MCTVAIAGHLHDELTGTHEWDAATHSSDVGSRPIINPCNLPWLIQLFAALVKRDYVCFLAFFNCMMVGGKRSDFNCGGVA
jgi:hypothetical protein